MKDKQAAALLAQKHQLDSSGNSIAKMTSGLAALNAAQDANDLETERLLAEAEKLQHVFSEELQQDENGNIVIFVENADDEISEFDIVEELLTVEKEEIQLCVPLISLVSAPEFDSRMDFDSYILSLHDYAAKQEIDLTTDPYKRLMSDDQRIALEKRIQEDFTYKRACCDQYDYMIAGTCGLVGGLIDIFFVGAPGTGALTKMTDEAVNGAVISFARLTGWEGGREGADPVKSAIGFLERKYTVNYDHRHGGDVDGLFSMSTKNHHIKSLAHSPDIIGLFFSILAQFTNTAHFVDNGKLIIVDTELFELHGSTVVAKVFSGFVNWVGHLFSDMAGSSGSQGRGSGIPIPFYALLQFVNIGEFGQHRQSFAKIAVQVFEQGYDMRHGIAMAIPVLITELLIRIMWVCKKRFYHKAEWTACVSSGSIPELRRMLLVGHGTLCLADGIDAAVRSGGEIISFLLRTNLIGWCRFGILALKELEAWYRVGKIDGDAVDDYLEQELRRMTQMRA